VIRTRIKTNVSLTLLGLCLSIPTITANAAFFDDVNEVVAANTPDVGSTILKRSVTSPDGRFTYVSGLNEIFIFSRDAATGSLTQTDIINPSSFPGDAGSVSFSPEDMLISPDGSFLYMSGFFGGIQPTGDTQIPVQSSVIKFNRDSESGTLSFDSFLDLSAQTSKSILEIALSDDGQRLLVARANGLEGESEVYLVNTANMESQFLLGDNQNTNSVLPTSTVLHMALSPDNQTLYLAGPQSSQRKEPFVGLAVIDVDRDNNRLSVRQSLNVEYYVPSDTRVDLSTLRVLAGIESIIASDDGAYVYTLGEIGVNTELNSAAIEAIGVWQVEVDGSLSLVRSLDKQELVYDVVGGTGEFSFASQLKLSPNGNNFLYVVEDQFFDGEADLTVFDRDPKTGSLTFIDDNIGTTELDGALNASFSPDARFINVIQGGSSATVTVMDTAVDRNVVISSANSQILPGATASLSAIVSNSGPTDDYAVQLLIEKPNDMTLATDEPDCSVLADGNVSCIRTLLVVGDQASFAITAQASQAISSNTVNATASSDKLDIDASNDTDSTIIEITNTPSENTGANAEGNGSQPSNDESANSSSAGGSSGGGGCTVSSRTHHDLLVLLLISAGVLWRRKRCSAVLHR